MHLFQYTQISNLTFTFALSIKQTLSLNKAYSFNNSKQKLFKISNQSEPPPLFICPVLKEEEQYGPAIIFWTSRLAKTIRWLPTGNC
ncbi:hypothetical protein CEXT_209121 [Caerostris extrusa]|uniref:Uncharacterized protein n=1 Tax=Caerostris extrusa TaxID=172846 RepID=A0AAV4MEZ8_CAEEX|nr:hypothetical protein CEXT_209121 [Caerostris extrusa]